MKCLIEICINLTSEFGHGPLRLSLTVYKIDQF